MKIPEIIEKNNRVWAVSSHAEKRVLVAQDCLERIKAGQYLPDLGNWLVIPRKVEDDEDIQTCLLESEACKTCAMGGLFASFVVFANELKGRSFERSFYSTRSVIGQTDLMRLTEIFDYETLKNIERAFEGGKGYYKFDDEMTEEEEAILNFYKSYKNDESRMMAIMENIIENKGEFLP